MTPTISLAMIVRDEGRTLRDCLASIAHYVDEVVIVDTGSSDDTMAAAHSFTNQVHYFPWEDNFSTARQYAFDQCSGEWLLWLDGDDLVLEASGMRDVVAAAPADVGALAARYITGRDAAGNITQEVWRERLVRRGAYVWHGRAHEVLVPRLGAPGRQVRTDTLVVEHKGKPGAGAAALARNIRLLELDATIPPAPRTLFYLARDTMQAGDADGALAYFDQYLALSSWDEERYQALVYVATLRLRAGLSFAGELAAFEAMRLMPAKRDAYFLLAELAYYQDHWSQVALWCEAGMAYGTGGVSMFGNAAALDTDWLILYTVALHHIGRTEDALKWTNRALELLPGNIWHTYNRTLFAELVVCAPCEERRRAAAAAGA